MQFIGGRLLSSHGIFENPTNTNSDHGKRILLVDDEELLRSLLAMVLRDLGYIVFEASDGEEALELVSTTTQPFLALISDLDMPQKNGDELIREIESRPRLFSAYVLMSGHGHEDYRIQTLLASEKRVPFFLYQKPFNPERLTDLLDALH